MHRSIRNTFVGLGRVCSAGVLALFVWEGAARADAVINGQDFAEPPQAYRTVPLWHLNGTLTRDGIAAQLQAARDLSGFGGVAVLPMSSTRPAYLSEGYFERYRDILDISKELGLSVIFYDDVDFPSGTAGGQLRAKYPDAIMSRLDKIEADVTGPQDWRQALPGGDFMGAVAMNMETMERRDISAQAADGTISWPVPEGRWKIMLFRCVRDGHHVDYMNPDAVERFMSLTYDKYYEQFPDHFGSTITMSFFDDINIRYLQYRNWTPGFNKLFEARHGYSPVKYYPALWHDIGPDTVAARVKLFDFRADLLAEGYPRMVNEWSRERGIRATGHAMGQYHPQPTFLAGDHIKFYRHCDIPMIDSIHYYGHGRPGYKLPSSASFTYDRPLTAVEIYGNYRHRPFDRAMLYRSGMELFARGANFLLPHGMWYNPAHVRLPPLISHFSNELGPELGAYNNWAARASLLLQGGRHVADIGVLYPVATMQAYARFDKVDGPHPGLTMPRDTDFNHVSDLLTGGIRRDFTFLHPEIIDEKCRVDGATFHLDNETNFEAYGVILLPSVSTIHWSNLQKIKAFYDNGGKVIATTRLPSYSAEFGHDREVVEAISAMFPSTTVNQQGYAVHTNPAGGAAYFVPSRAEEGAALAAALDHALPVADVRFGPGTPPFVYLPQSGSGPPRQGRHEGMLSYIHKVKEGRNIYFFANSTDQAMDVDVLLRGDVKLQWWNPDDGSITDAQSEPVVRNETPCTQVRLKLGPVKSIFLVESTTP